MGGSLVDTQATPTHHSCQGARAQPGDGEDEDHQLNMEGGKWWEMGVNHRSLEGRHMEPVTGEALTCSTVFTLSQKPSGTLHKCK